MGRVDFVDDLQIRHDKKSQCLFPGIASGKMTSYFWPSTDLYKCRNPMQLVTREGNSAKLTYKPFTNPVI